MALLRWVHPKSGAVVSGTTSAGVAAMPVLVTTPSGCIAKPAMRFTWTSLTVSLMECCDAPTRDGGLCWPQAEHRGQPEFIQTQTGYMQGAAGIASFLLHLATVKAGNPVKIRFPEAPFARTA